MEGSPNSLGGWTWWLLTAVILAFVVNLAADYFKPKVDRYLQGYSSSRRIANEKKRQKLEQRVAELLDDPTEVSIQLYFLDYNLRFMTLFSLASMIAMGITYSQATYGMVAMVARQFTPSNDVVAPALIERLVWEVVSGKDRLASGSDWLFQTGEGIVLMYIVTLGASLLLLVGALVFYRSWQEHRRILGAYRIAKRERTTEKSTHSDSADSVEAPEKPI